MAHLPSSATEAPPHPVASSPAAGGAQPAVPQPPTSRRRISSAELLGRATEIEITHGSQCYRLRLTSLGKLILTK